MCLLLGRFCPEKVLFPTIKQQIITQLDRGSQETTEEQSAEIYKEVNNKYYMRKLLVLLSRDESGQPVMFSEEVVFVPQNSKGLVYLMIGTNIGIEEADLIVKCVGDDFIISLSETTSETKRKEVPL